MKLKIFLSTLLFSSGASSDESWQYRHAAEAIYASIVEANHGYQNVSGMLHGLYLLQNEYSNKKLVELSGRYLGSSNASELDALVINQGVPMLPLIKAEFSRLAVCTEPGCDIKLKKSRLSRWQEAIETGTKIQLVP